MMLYPSDHEITVEELREFVGDDDPAAEVFGDDRYEDWIARYPGDWRMAAIAAADRMLLKVAENPIALGSDGDSIRWSEARISILRAKRDALAADVDGASSIGRMTVSQRFLTPIFPEGGA